jgi:hypothetical protein
MQWADSQGLAQIGERLDSLHTLFGEHWRPAALIRRLARDGLGFADFKEARN